MSLRDRPTSDLVVLGLTALVAFVVTTTVTAALVIKIADPKADIDVIMIRVAGLTNTLIGAIVGYLAGRGARPSSE